jgi:hypothetical protein
VRISPIINFKLNIYNMDEVVDKDIPLLKKSCEQLCRELKLYSTPLDKCAQARDSGIATTVCASGGECLLQSSHIADDTVMHVRIDAVMRKVQIRPM